MFAGLEIFHRLGKVNLNEIEEGAVVLLLHQRIAYDESTVCDDCEGVDCSGVHCDAELTLSRSTRALGLPAWKTLMSIIESVAVESVVPSEGFKKYPNQERGWQTAHRAF